MFSHARVSRRATSRPRGGGFAGYQRVTEHSSDPPHAVAAKHQRMSHLIQEALSEPVVGNSRLLGRVVLHLA